MSEVDQRAQTRTQVSRIVAELAVARGHQGVPRDDAQPLSELGFDSLLLVELVARLEDDLEVEIPDEALAPGTFETLGSTVDLVLSLR